MLKINDRIIHFRDGIGTIVGKTTMMDREYFVIRTDSNPGENIYVLTTNTVNVIRPLLSKKEAEDLLSGMDSIEAEIFNNTKQRRDFYKKKLLSGQVSDLLYLTKQLYCFEYYNSHGKPTKLGSTDLQMLRDAKQILFDELVVSLKIDESSIEKYFISLLEKNC